MMAVVHNTLIHQNMATQIEVAGYVAPNPNNDITKYNGMQLVAPITGVVGNMTPMHRI